SPDLPIPGDRFRVSARIGQGFLRPADASPNTPLERGKEDVSMRCRSSLLLAMLAGLGFGTAQAQTRIVTGRVVDSLTKQPITSGQVAVQGTQVGTTIKDDGTFTIAAPTRDVMLMVRSIGFKRKDIALPASQNSAQVALERDYFQLEAIIV